VGSNVAGIALDKEAYAFSPETVVGLSREVTRLTLYFGFQGVEKCVELSLWVTKRTHYKPARV